MGAWVEGRMSADAPRLSMVICTYNRAARVTTGDRQRAGVGVRHPRAASSSTTVPPTTPRSAVSKITDPRPTYVKRENGGLSAARNTGVRHCIRRLPGLPRRRRPAAPRLVAHGATIARRGSVRVDELGGRSGRSEWTAAGSAPSGADGRGVRGLRGADPRRHVRGLACNVHIVVGGFTEGLRANQQTDFGSGPSPCGCAEGWKVGVIDETLVRIVRSASEDRSRNRPEWLMASAAHLVDSYGEQLARSPNTLADYLAVAGVAAAHTGTPMCDGTSAVSSWPPAIPGAMVATRDG